MTGFSLNVSAQLNPTFFPEFMPYEANPVIKYGQGFNGAAWNDPVVLKQGTQYIMYASAKYGFTGPDAAKIYRLISSDGYNWALSPATPVVTPAQGTYYEGGTETPSVVYKDGVYHMYLTAYPAEKIPADFVIAHAVSTDGIKWNMDTQPLLESDGSNTWNGSVVGEPGALVFNDSIYVYFTGAGIYNSKQVQGIGLMKSGNGTDFSNPALAVTIPEEIYPASQNYIGLSTPSALAVNDTIYLFTDIVQLVNGTWTQVALHQFKTYGTTGIWYHDNAAIHTKEDFSWTNGSFYSELRSVTPLLDDDNRLRIWYAGNRLADVSGKDTTYYIIIESAEIFHADPAYWGIGTSEYRFSAVTGTTTSLEEEDRKNENILSFDAASEKLIVRPSCSSEIHVFDLLGKEFYYSPIIERGYTEVSTEKFASGFYIVTLSGHNGALKHMKLVIEK